MMATPGVIGERHYRIAKNIRETLAQYAELKDIISMLGIEQLTTQDRDLVYRARKLERFLTQPFYTIKMHYSRFADWGISRWKGLKA